MVGTQLEGDLFDAVKAFAEQNTGGNMSAALRELVRTALFARSGQLGSLAGRNLESSGYNEGIRQGLHDVKVAIRNAVQNLWQ